MTHYFYDDVAAKLIAYDDETGTARELRGVQIGQVPPSSFTEPQHFPTKKVKKDRVKEPKTPKVARTGNGCPECGSLGRRHKNGCPRAGSGAKPKEGNQRFKRLGDAPRSDAMSRMTFGRVKISQLHDIPAETIARNMDMAEEEVDKAFEVETYDDYLKA